MSFGERELERVRRDREGEERERDRQRGRERNKEKSSIFASFNFRATGGELFRLIAKDPLSEDQSREVVYQILDGVKHLHSLNIVHLDLKVRKRERERGRERERWTTACVCGGYTCIWLRIHVDTCMLSAREESYDFCNCIWQLPVLMLFSLCT